METTALEETAPSDGSNCLIDCDDGTIALERLADGRLTVSVVSLRTSLTLPLRHVVTSTAAEVVREIAAVKGAAYVCDELARAEAPDYVEGELRRDLLGYVRPGDLRGAAILDFGCGSGASTIVLSRLIPEAALIDGTEFEPAFVRLARRRIGSEVRGPRVSIQQQEHPLELPSTLQQYDLIVCSAVIEHMLPMERRVLLPQLWACLRTGGIFFLNQTPHRWFPIEAHTTNLVGLNYLPARLAQLVASWTGRVPHDASWEDSLRHGIRGSTEREIVSCLTSGASYGRSAARILAPLPPNRDRVALWRSGLRAGRRELLKSTAATTLRCIERITGSVCTQNITLALQKVR